jgi:polynucleotide 5'-hydroxyl-kinase GRC3/NOL9
MKAWNQAAESLAAQPGLAMLLGASDTGKSSLAALLANHLLGAGIRVAVVDADIGQSDIGPPGTVGMGLPAKPIRRLADVTLEDAYFVGSNSPEGHSLSLLVGCAQMVARARDLGAEAIILDTTGLVHGRGARVLSHFSRDLLRPDFVVALEREGELEHLLRPMATVPGLNLIRLRASPRAQLRSRQQRKSARERAFRSHLAGARTLELPLDRVNLLRTIYGTGRRLDAAEYPGLSERLGCPVLHAEWIAEGLYLVLGGSFEQGRMDRLKEQEGVEQILTSRTDRLRDLLVGLAGPDNDWQGIGILLGLDFDNRMVQIHTVADAARIRAIHVGILRVSISGEEMGRIFPNDI